MGAEQATALHKAGRLYEAKLYLRFPLATHESHGQAARDAATKIIVTSYPFYAAALVWRLHGLRLFQRGRTPEPPPSTSVFVLLICPAGEAVDFHLVSIFALVRAGLQWGAKGTFFAAAT